MRDFDSHSEVWVEPLTQTVLIKLRELILSGGLTPGVRLRAESLAAQLGVSRTPIRSALAIMAVEGIVGYQTNRGYTVREQSVELVVAAIEARAPLQAAAARALALSEGRETTLRRLAVLHEILGKLARSDHWDAETERSWHETHYAFHREILHASGNPYLRTALRMTIVYPAFGDILRIYPPVSARVRPECRELPPVPPPYTIETQFDHERLLVRLSDGDAERASSLVYEKVLRERDRILAALDDSAPR